MKNKLLSFLTIFTFIFAFLFISTNSSTNDIKADKKVYESNRIKKAFDFNYFNYESNDNIVLVAKNKLNERIIKTDIIVGINEADNNNYNVRLMFQDISVSDPLSNNSFGEVVEPTFTSIKTTKWLYFDSISKDLLINGFKFYLEFFNYNNVIGVESTFYYLNDLLESVEHSTTHYNNFLDLSSFFTPSTITTYQTFNELRFEGVNFLGKYYFDLGWEARKDSIADNESKINYIWTILEKGVTTVFNVLSMEILPGIPLFICIVVPVMLGLILWIVKMGGS